MRDEQLHLGHGTCHRLEAEGPSSRAHVRAVPEQGGVTGTSCMRSNPDLSSRRWVARAQAPPNLMAESSASAERGDPIQRGTKALDQMAVSRHLAASLGWSPRKFSRYARGRTSMHFLMRLDRVRT